MRIRHTLLKKNSTHALGSLMVVGKDNDGRKLILPTHEHQSRIGVVNKNQLLSQKDRNIFNRFLVKVISYFKKNEYLEEQNMMYVALKAKDANTTTRGYMRTVDEILAPLLFNLKLHGKRKIHG